MAGVDPLGACRLWAETLFVCSLHKIPSFTSHLFAHIRSISPADVNILSRSVVSSPPLSSSLSLASTSSVYLARVCRESSAKTGTTRTGTVWTSDPPAAASISHTTGYPPPSTVVSSDCNLYPPYILIGSFDGHVLHSPTPKLDFR